MASRDVSGYFLVKNGEFAYNKSCSNGYPWGAIKRLDYYDMGVLSTLYIVFKPTNVSSQFLVSYYDTTKWYKEVAKNAAEGARNHGLLNIAPSDFFSTVLEIPASLAEQDKIGDFLKKTDTLIAANQRKVDALKEQKSAYLERIFNQSLRFSGFTEPWVSLKLGENATILTGGTPKTTEPSYWEPKEIPWMSSGEVNKKRLESTDNMISKTGLENSSARWVKQHSILIALAGQGKTRGMVAINNIPLTTNQSIAAIEPNESLDYEFAFQNLGNRYDELRMNSSGDGTRGGLNKKIISDILISAPDINEQKQIGKLFASLDNLIASNQRKVDLLTTQKSAYLQQMFL